MQEEKDSRHGQKQSSAPRSKWLARLLAAFKCFGQLRQSAQTFQHCSEAAPPAAWLGYTGPAFADISRLCVLSRSAQPCLSASFFSGLSHCSKLTRLEVVAGPWAALMHRELALSLATFPDKLSAWLPHVTELGCAAVSDPQLPVLLINGLGPALKQLDICDGAAPDPCDCARALFACEQLQRVSLKHISQPVLDELVHLPALTHVEISCGTSLDNITDSHPTSCSAWQELKVPSCKAEQLAMLPLSTTQRVVVKSLHVSVPPPAVMEAQVVRAHAAQRKAIAAVAAVPDLQWGGRLVIRACIRAHVESIDGAAAGQGEQCGHQQQGAAGTVLPSDPQAVGAAHMYRLHETVTSLAPLAARGCQAVMLDVLCEDTLDGWSGLGEAIAAALGATFGHSLDSLWLLFRGHPLAVQPSFWTALPKHLPELSWLKVEGVAPRLDEASAAVLAQMWPAASGGRGSLSELSWSMQVPDVLARAVRAVQQRARKEAQLPVHGL